MITLLLTTHKHPKDAGRVLNEMNDAKERCKEPIEIFVVGHEPEDIPQGHHFGIPYIYHTQKEKGCARSIHYAAKNCSGKYVVYLCDDHLFPDKDWLNKLIDIKNSNLNIKLFRINDGHPEGDYAAIGMFNREWFINHYPTSIYNHYGWDNDIRLLAILENAYMNCMDVKVTDPDKIGRINMEFKTKDLETWIKRRKKLIGE